MRDMRTAGLILAGALVFGSGCAKTDWIDRTLVTVDVTGTWYGGIGGGYGSSKDVLFEFDQQGSTVKGFMRLPTGGTSLSGSSSARINPGPIDGTVAGDVFRFRLRESGLEGELTVSGDEMNGRTSFGGPISLRRVDPPSRLSSPPR